MRGNANAVFLIPAPNNTIQFSLKGVPVKKH
jgi:hypothetical protein